MAKFIFALRQRVSVPVSDAQGVITQRSESVAGPNQYFIEFLTIHGQRATLWLDEPEIFAANGPAVASGASAGQPANLQLATAKVAVAEAAVADRLKPIKRKAKKRGKKR